MDNALRFGSKPQKQLMVLTAIISATEISRFMKQLPTKGREMADIVIRQKIIRRKIRFEMYGKDRFQPWTGKHGLVCIDEIRSLPGDNPPDLIECRRVQDIIMVKQGYVLSLSHGQSSIGIFCYAAIISQPLICYAGIMSSIFPNYATSVHLIVTAICQAKLPFPISLCLH